MEMGSESLEAIESADCDSAAGETICHMRFFQLLCDARDVCGCLATMKSLVLSGGGSVDTPHSSRVVVKNTSRLCHRSASGRAYSRITEIFGNTGHTFRLYTAALLS